VSTDLSGNGLIRGAEIVDGTGTAPYRADIRIVDGRIAEIGADLRPQGEPEYDASGCYVTPGFIDSHTHYDASLFWDPACDPITLHGVTTVLIGNCALGLAPVRKEGVGELGALFSYIEDLPREVFASEVPWTWETFGQYAEVMRARRYGVNVAALVSHSLLRLYEAGAEAWARPSTADECGRIGATAEAAMAAGAFGVSTSRFDRSPAGELVPSYHADDAEFEALFTAVGRHRGVVQIIPDMGDIAAQEKDIRRMADFGRRHRTPVISNQIYQRPDQPDYAPTLLEAARQVRAEGAPFHFLASPRSIDLLVNFHQSMNFMYVPAWNEVVQGDVPKEKKLASLADPAWRARARADWDAVPEGFPSGGMERLFKIVKVGAAKYEPLLGHSFARILDERGGHPSDVIAEWVLENDLEAEFIYPFTNTDIDQVAGLLKAEETLISASDAGAHIGMFDGAGDPTLVLARHVRDRGDMTLEYAVRRMTGDQAELLGLADRGVIRPGAIADLAVFDLGRLHWDVEKKVTDVPGGRPRFRRPPGGFRYTFVGGVPVQIEGKATGALPARFLGAEDRVACPA
jgi:N-acyl-D-aspartate/D-glutamate deacylase